MKNLDLEGVFANFEELKAKSMDSLRTTFNSMDEQTKIDIHHWLSDIKAIKQNPELTTSQKEAKLSKVKTSETVLNFIKSFVEVLLHKIPIQNKGMLSSGLTGVTMAMSMLRLNAKATVVALIVLQKGLPKFIMSNKFDQFAAFVERELPTVEADSVEAAED